MIAPLNKIPLAFRVGVTGTREIRPDAERVVRAELSQVLELISGEIGKLARNPASQAVYARQSDGSRSGRLRLVSPLAEGSDRLAAEEALDAGYALYAPLPFPRSEYEKDFPDSVEEFRRLLSTAEILELDGTREFANESYREAGRFVVRNCDLLIAVWDGASERGPGGTAEIVRFAANLRVPVWWIDASGHSLSRFIETPQKLRAVRANDAGAAGRDGLVRYIERSIVPPQIATAERPGVFGRLAGLLSRALRDEASPLDQYLNETGLQTKGIWGTYSVVMNAMALKAAGAWSNRSSLAPPSNKDDWWLKYFQPADRLSEACGNRYRSSYVMIAALAVVVAASAIGDLLPHRIGMLANALEIAAIAAVVALVLANYYYHWHERWISYRLLAELFRKQSMLWTIGRSLPAQEVLQSALSSAESEDGEQSRPPRDSWIGWYFAAVNRAAPTLTGPLDVKKEDAAASANALVEEQIQYHRRRVVGSNAAASVMERAGQFFLLVTAIVGCCKIVFWVTHPAGSHSEWLRTLGALLSALTASFVALRAYSELPLLAQQSNRMIKTLKRAETELAAIDVGEPGASWELGHTINALALSMMEDVTGWMQLFRLKSLETPDVH
ncbi:MAG TPA: hypothetical protein VGM09_13900 [Bradyrhizobium sp.]|jgi:hypothetical protein